LKQKHIVVIEDEKDILDVLEYNLKREGFKVSISSDGKSGLDMVRQSKPDLVLLDIMLPELDGLDVCQSLKNDSVTNNIPIIMVTAKEEESDVVLGLGLGADDYITKPFSPKELIARVKALLRRSKATNHIDSSSNIIIGPLKIDPEQFSVQLSKQTLSLTSTEFRLLHKLASQPGRVFSRDQLLQDAVGEHIIVSDRNIDVHIRSIRKSLGKYKHLIETVRSVGYRFKDSGNQE
jgi:two-component system phosphate regulon response regulator PhoB